MRWYFILKLWFIFAKKRILGTNYCYRYYSIAIVSFAGSFAVFETYGKHYANIPANIAGYIFICIPLFSLATEAIARALQKTVFIMDLPGYLTGKQVHFNNEFYSNCKKGNECNNKPKMGMRLFFAAYQSVLNKPVNIVSKENSMQCKEKECTIAEYVDWKKIEDKRNQVGKGQSGKKEFITSKNIAKNNKNKKCGKVCCHASYNYYQNFSKVFWWCRSCAHATGWNFIKNDSGTVNFCFNNSPATAKNKLLNADSKESQCYKMPKFMENASYIKANKENKEKCCYLKHIADQTPYEKLNYKTKLSIYLTFPLWLVQLLLTPGIVRINSHKKYHSCTEDGLKNTFSFYYCTAIDVISGGSLAWFLWFRLPVIFVGIFAGKGGVGN